MGCHIIKDYACVSAVIKTWSFSDKISYLYVLCKMTFLKNFTEFAKFIWKPFLESNSRRLFCPLETTLVLFLYIYFCATEYFFE